MKIWRSTDYVLLVFIICRFIRSITAINCTTEMMEFTTNISVQIMNISKTHCFIQWTIHPIKNMTGIELNLKNLNLNGTPHRTVTELETTNRSWALTDLERLTTYQIFIEVYYRRDFSCKSDVQNFTTLGVTLVSKTTLTYVAETVIVLAVLSAWGLAVYLFINQWGNLRVTPEHHPRYKHAQPKNIETIKVVKRANDSVIYRNYSRQMSFTMEKREKRIERINTLRQLGIDPNILDSDDMPAVKEQPIPSTSSMPQSTISTITVSMKT